MFQVISVIGQNKYKRQSCRYDLDHFRQNIHLPGIKLIQTLSKTLSYWRMAVTFCRIWSYMVLRGLFLEMVVMSTSVLTQIDFFPGSLGLPSTHFITFKIFIIKTP